MVEVTLVTLLLLFLQLRQVIYRHIFSVMGGFLSASLKKKPIYGIIPACILDLYTYYGHVDVDLLTFILESLLVYILVYLITLFILRIVR